MTSTPALHATTIAIHGMHCPNCEVLIERRLKGIPGVVAVIARQHPGSAEIHSQMPLDTEAVRKILEEEGYILETGQARVGNTVRDYAEIGAILVVLLGLFLAVKETGWVPRGFSVSDNTGYGLAFLIGLAASVTSCMAVTGGLLVALAARYNEVNSGLSSAQKLKPHLAFNAGRLVSYPLLGGAVGALGSALTLSPQITSLLTIIASAVMILLGLQMLKLLPALGRFAPLLPKGFAHRLHDLAARNSGKGAFLLGALTFFLPCGFTQALQLYVLAKGSFTLGALTMLAFALGTLPALLSLSALASFARGSFQRHFLKVAGVAVILLGFLNVQYGFVLAGNSAGPVATAAAPEVTTEAAPPPMGDAQIVAMRIEDYSYIPNRFTVKQGVPVEWRIDAREAAGCGRVLISRGLRIQQFLSDSQITVIRFTPQVPGEYSFNCSMGMMTPGSGFTVLPGNMSLRQIEKL